MENLDRGLVAVNKGDGEVFVSWRLLGTESPDTGFNLYRASGSAAPVKFNPVIMKLGTNFEDSGVNLSQAVTYTVRAVIDGREQAPSKPFVLPANAPARRRSYGCSNPRDAGTKMTLYGSSVASV